MKQTRLLLVGAAALTLWGCGGGGSSTTGSTNSLADGRAALNGMASGAQPTTTQSLQQALTLFQQATQQDPTSSQAKFGAAVALSGVIAQEVNDASVGVSAGG